MPTTTDEHGAFLAAICEAPEDDFPRLQYADWLEENAGMVTCGRCAGRGRLMIASAYEITERCPDCDGAGRVSDSGLARSEFIRVQCELAKLGPCKDECRNRIDHECGGCVLWRRERELLALHGRAWASDSLEARLVRVRRPSDGAIIVADRDRLPIRFPRQDGPDGIGEEYTPYVFRRGFVEQVTLTAEAWLQHGPELVRAAPLTSVALVGKRPFLFYPSEPKAVGWLLDDEDDPYSVPDVLFWRLTGKLCPANADFQPQCRYSSDDTVNGVLIEDLIQAQDAALVDLSRAALAWARLPADRRQPHPPDETTPRLPGRGV